MISFAALGRFAAELLAFLAGLAGFALVSLRPELLSRNRVSRAALALGFALIAAAAFVEGSLIIHDRSLPEMVAGQGVGLVALLVGSRHWEGGRRSRRLLWIGIAGMALATGLLADKFGSPADVALSIGAAGIAVALHVASRRSIAALIAASLAAILLLIVLVLSVALSALMSTTVRNEAALRLDARAVTEADSAQTTLQRLDSTYLNTQLLKDKVGLAIVSLAGGPVSRGCPAAIAEAGNPGPCSQLLALAKRTVNSGGPIPLATGGGLLSATQPFVAGKRSLVMVAATPEKVVTDVRDELLRALFLLALAGTLTALGLAAYSGERVSHPIRLLTEAAQRIQAGDFARPTGVRSDNEVGVLGAAFDSMALSLSEQTTALQLAAKEEATLHNQLEAVVAGIGEAVIAIDADGRITLFNRAAEELIGLSDIDVEGEPVGDVLVAVGEEGAVLAKRLQRPLPSRWTTTATVATELGPRIPVGITAGPLRALDGGVSGGVLVLRDLRPERQVEQLKSEFLSRIGHELRTPLTGILGFAEILLHRDVPRARAQDMHQQIVDAARRLYRVVQMLEFSAAAQAGHSLLRSEPMSMRALMEEAATGWADRVDGGHTIVRRVPRDLPEITGDRRWLAMAIDELIDNAVKFSPEGGKVGLTARLATWGPDDDERPAVQITVTDDGIGLSEGEQRHVFADFVQADGSDTRQYGGLGLGLSLVKRVAEAHGGGVQVESLPQHGSKFSMIVPVRRPSDV